LHARHPAGTPPPPRQLLWSWLTARCRHSSLSAGHLLTLRRERRWKAQQAKKFSGQISRGNMHIEAREVAREEQQQKAIRQKASWVAKQASCTARCCAVLRRGVL